MKSSHGHVTRATRSCILDSGAFRLVRMPCLSALEGELNTTSPPNFHFAFAAVRVCENACA